jgi:hypothetical protein
VWRERYIGGGVNGLARRKYKFRPAMKDGKPVAVDLYIDVNFEIL